MLLMVQLPNTTYRIQFNKDFTLRDLEDLIPYLTRLGIGAIYASPIFRAVPGSTHGYDQTDPTRLNPEIGSLQELKRVATELSRAGIGWIQDIVPNHMAIHPDNRWLWDVLEKGPHSVYHKFFDTPFASPSYFSGRLMLPFLDAPLEDAIRTGRITVSANKEGFGLAFGGQVWPINAEGQAFIQTQTRPLDDPVFLRDLIALQYYEPCNWKETNHRINYRRFFTVNSLIALNVHDEEVFGTTHRQIAQLVKEGIFTGLRIDHVDGLADPTAYLYRLRQLVGERVFIVVEKILQLDERLPSHWPVQGTTGYDFLALANAVLSDGSGEKALSRFYGKFTGQQEQVPPLLWRAKQSQLVEAMAGELDNLSRFLQQAVVAKATPRGNSSLEALKSALAHFIVHCPVYRWYGHAFPLPEPEGEAITMTLHQAAVSHPGARKELALLEELLVAAPAKGRHHHPADIALLYQRCMQLTGALMAKGLEDTLMYTYNRYIGANEVGGSPAEFSRSVADFHRFMESRARDQPHSLNATATHDTKRGEDVTARLQVITAFPRDWIAAVTQWANWNAPLKTKGAPDANDEYFIYQTIWGTFPMAHQPLQPYLKRLEAYLIKAMREAKRQTDWASPNETYERSVIRFVRRILRERTPFLGHFRSLHAEYNDLSILNSLTKVVLKFTCPGTPDCYQGSEGWDYSFVDPDNRRPVDFALRRAWQQQLHGLRTSAGTLGKLWEDRCTGQLKYSITEWLAHLRRQYPDIFLHGLYIPVKAAGRFGNQVLSFIRRRHDQWLLVVVPLHIPGNISWGSTRIPLPHDAPRRWRNVFTDEIHEGITQFVPDQHFRSFPIGVWIAAEKPESTQRAAGVLMPLFSLPGPYGIGDLGDEAYRFVDFLRQAGQRYWLMLPHHPTDEAVAYSPYSGHSAMAGNTLYLDLADFVRQGWLVQTDLETHQLASTSAVAYGEASALKNVLYGKAFRNYLRQWAGRLDPGFAAFCRRESAWLDDYALYSVLSDMHRGKPWYAWPVAYRDRQRQALDALGSTHGYELKKVKWLQYQFCRQWERLRRYSRRSGVQFIGDIPFYVNHDSADVWAHPHLFKLHDDGSVGGMAGVPPDYFNAEGQLWGMPVYRWENHAADDFDWWTKRITHNLRFYDLLRLDHFRAFCDFWEIPRAAKSAKEGAWKPGPKEAPFRAVLEAMGNLPLIAEDLGDIHEEVYRLRDELGIPGMKVLQFAFGDDIASSLHAPHHHRFNEVVFTGTHDNNTAAGWYRDELEASGRARMKDYTGVGALTPQRAAKVLVRLAYASPAKWAIAPMQDLLGLGTASRMNVPASPTGNWSWRLAPALLTDRLKQQLRHWAHLYGRL